MNATNGMIGLSLLSGSALGSWAQPLPLESRAVRVARAQYKLAPIAPPWSQAAKLPPLSIEVAAVRSLRSIVERPRAGLPADVGAAFTVYKAIERLQSLAQAAVNGTDLTRANLASAFTRGMIDLAGFLADAPGDLLTFSLNRPDKRAETLAVASVSSNEVLGKIVVPQRIDAIPGLTGSERFTIILAKTGGSDAIVVDLAGTPQPPTLDSVAAAFNAAIAAVPQREVDGTVSLDARGNPRSRWTTNFSVVKSGTGWGLQLNAMGIETVSLSVANAPATLVVTVGQGAADTPQALTLSRFDDPAGTFSRSDIGRIGAIDGQATAEAMLTPAPKPLLPGDPIPSRDVAAALNVRASVSDGAGNTFVLGTSAGDLGANRGNGGEDLVLTKLDSRGAVLWTQALGASGTASGAALSLAPDGGVIVAGTVIGGFDGAQSDGDMLVARFGADGSEQFTTLVRALGADVAGAVAIASDGTIAVGGRSASGDAILARLDSSGRLIERRTIDTGTSESVAALAFAADGTLLAAIQEGATATVRRIGATLATDLGRAEAGTFDLSAMTVAAAGSIGLVGTGTGGQGGRDGIVALVNPGLTAARTTVVGTAGDDRLDSLTFVDGAIYVGGRTSGLLGAAKTGAVDAFVARIGATGALADVRQWGIPGQSAEAVSVTTSRSDAAIRALGFADGILHPTPSPRLIDQTSLRTGQSFLIRLDNGPLRKMTVQADDTLQSFTARLSALAGRDAAIKIAKVDGGQVLRIEPKSGHRLDLLAGPEGADALRQLGLTPTRLLAGTPSTDKAPRIRPGGHYGLDLSTVLNLGDKASAALALDRLQSAVSTTQSAFRSLFWDENKAAIVDGAARKGKVSPYEAQQLGRYSEALKRLGGPSTANIFGQ